MSDRGEQGEGGGGGGGYGGGDEEGEGGRVVSFRGRDVKGLRVKGRERQEGRRRNGGIGGVEVDCGPGWRPEKYVSC